MIKPKEPSKQELQAKEKSIVKIKLYEEKEVWIHFWTTVYNKSSDAQRAVETADALLLEFKKRAKPYLDEMRLGMASCEELQE